MNANDTASLELGEDMLLARVIALASCQLSPVTIGLKLPLHLYLARRPLLRASRHSPSKTLLI